MVITETGAGTAVAKALPSLEETNFECDSCSVPNGSLVVLNLGCPKKLRLMRNAIMKNMRLKEN
jgi:glyceraldehyde 3-phosphate dehydrogenase